MERTKLKAIADQLFYEMWNNQDLNKVDDLFADEFQIHYSVDSVSDHDTFKQLLQQWFEGIPDLQHEIDDYICEENKVVTRWHGKGTHLGRFLDIPATGKPFYYGGITILEINSAGKITKAWVYNDLMTTVSILKNA